MAGSIVYHPVFPVRKYNLIYADPPWLYSNTLGDRAAYGAATSAYPCMPTEDICALPVGDLAASNCALVLWTTGPKQEEAMRVVHAWGFRYVTWLLVWVKTKRHAVAPYYTDDLHKGRGQYTRPNAEIAWLATKGYAPVVQEPGVHQILFAPLPDGQHSRKPSDARRRLEILFGNVPRIELFARQQVPGWDVWGNEV